MIYGKFVDSSGDTYAIEQSAVDDIVFISQKYGGKELDSIVVFKRDLPEFGAMVDRAMGSIRSADENKKTGSESTPVIRPEDV